MGTIIRLFFKTVAIGMLTISINVGIAQKCTLFPTGLDHPHLPYSKDYSHVPHELFSLYEEATSRNDSSWKILYISSHQYTRSITYIKISDTGNIVKRFNTDFWLKEDTLSLIQKTSLNQILPRFRYINTNYLADCSRYKNTHGNEYLLICNSKAGRFVDIFAMDGTIKEILEGKGGHQMLVDIYDVLNELSENAESISNQKRKTDKKY